eukprot:735109-Hanusia_phi.AAC.1
MELGTISTRLPGGPGLGSEPLRGSPCQKPHGWPGRREVRGPALGGDRRGKGMKALQFSYHYPPVPPSSHQYTHRYPLPSHPHTHHWQLDTP